MRRDNNMPSALFFRDEDHQSLIKLKPTLRINDDSYDKNNNDLSVSESVMRALGMSHRLGIPREPQNKQTDDFEKGGTAHFMEQRRIYSSPKAI